MENNTKCDVIIPIYNAYDAVKECVKTVIENTDLQKHQLILINDKSPDKKIKELLTDVKKTNNKLNIVVIENEENLGFVGTVNKGMKQSKNDVLLLNSDTEVPTNWLENIIKCAYSEPKIATVTALSNNATLASVPEGLRKNELPQEYSFNEYAKIIEDCSFCDYPVLPTAHGFCMYIKREILDIVGYFDEKTFGKGYGEENDFSFRCMDYGYKNVLCDNVIVYHKESQSFQDVRKKLSDEHQKILNQKYPFYTSQTELWCNSFPINYICKNIKYSTNLNNRINILILIHEWDGHVNQFGGTTLHVKQLINNLRNKYNFHVLTKEDSGYKIYSYFKNTEDMLNLNQVNNLCLVPTYDSEYKKMVSNVIDALQISVVHVNHMINQFFDIGNLIKEKKIKGIISLHDFYSLCPTVTMLYKNEKNCLDLDNKKCDLCLKTKMGINNNMIQVWQNDWNTFLKKFNYVIVPSEYTNETLSKKYSDIHFKTIEHGVDLKINKATHLNKKSKYNIAFMGVMVPHKGSNILIELKNKLKKSNITIHLFGYSDNKKLTHNSKNYIYHGKYQQKQITELLKQNNIDLVCLFSICCETYSYTLTESIAAGIPVLSFNIGSLSSRITKNNYGYTISSNASINEITAKIKDIFDNPDNYNHLIDNINNYKIKSCHQMSQEYDLLYETDLKKSNTNYDLLHNLIIDSYKKNNSINNETLNMIVNSLKWKIVSKIKVPTAVKSTIKKIIR